VWFDVFATRHHAPGTSFGLALPGSFVWTGDTRPIPEMLAQHASRGEVVAHDCALNGNPSHTGVDDLAREYPEALRGQLILYHYASAADAAELARHGYRVARLGEAVELVAPHARIAEPEAVG
jgi:ribonuclease BN (tRNA processing enzyme)